jgi:hypothetical protein
VTALDLQLGELRAFHVPKHIKQLVPAELGLNLLFSYSELGVNFSFFLACLDDFSLEGKDCFAPG